MNDDVEFNEYSIALKGVDVNFDKSLNGRRINVLAFEQIAKRNFILLFLNSLVFTVNTVE